MSSSIQSAHSKNINIFYVVQNFLKVQKQDVQCTVSDVKK